MARPTAEEIADALEPFVDAPMNRATFKRLNKVLAELLDRIHSTESHG